MKDVQIITDGACLGNPGPGGWACLLRFKAKEKLIVGAETATTNNRMELQAVIEGLRALKQTCNVSIKTDSQYVIKAFQEGWLDSWQANGWKTAGGKPVANQDLWQDLLTLSAKHHIQWIWIKGHSGDPDNERVDLVARTEAERIAKAAQSLP